jgi:PAS domain S-box-containing protein
LKHFSFALPGGKKVMQTTPKPRRLNLFLYLFFGLVFGLLLAGLASVVSLWWAGIVITWDNLLQLHLSTPLFWLIDVYAIIFALLFGFIGLQRDKTVYARAQLQWANQKHSTDLEKLNDSMLQQDQKYQELDAVISRGKQQWEATFDAVKDLIILTDETGLILRCNRATGEAFQTGFSQLIGQQIDDLFLGAVADESAQRKILTDKTEIQFPELEGWYEVSRNFLMIDGQQSGWVYVFRNISDRKHALQELQRLNQYYKMLVKNSPIAIVTFALDDRIVDCNPAFETLFGFDKREVIGWNLDSLICPPDLMSEARAMGEALRQGETVYKVTQRQRKDGTLVDMEVFGIPVVIGGRQVGALGLYHDISELVGMQQEDMLTALDVEEEMLSEDVDTEEPESVLMEEPAYSEEEDLSDEVEREIVSEVPDLGVDQETEPEPDAWLAEDAHEDTKTSRYRAIAIEKIEGVGPVYAQKLADAGIKTTEDLLDFGKTRKGREELVEKLRISEKLVLKWVNMADLMRVKGIGEEYSELLERAGVDTVRELRNRRPDNLHAALIAANETHQLVRRPPHLSEVENWVQSAKELEPLVTY